MKFNSIIIRRLSNVIYLLDSILLHQLNHLMKTMDLSNGYSIHKS